MIGKATVNLQDSFLNQVRKDNSEIEMVLVNGTHLTGLVRGFDNFTVVVNAAGKQHLVYKHAIAQIVSQRPIQDTSAQQPAQGQGQPQPSREQREPREPREPRDRDRERRPQPPRVERSEPPRPEGAERERREQQPQQPRPEKKEQQSAKDKFNVLDFSDVKLDQQKS